MGIMTRADIEKSLEKVSYVVIGGQYAVCHTDDLDGQDFEEHGAESMDMTVISLDRPFDDELDVADTLTFCGLYAGQ